MITILHPIETIDLTDKQEPPPEPQAPRMTTIADVLNGDPRYPLSESFTAELRKHPPDWWIFLDRMTSRVYVAPPQELPKMREYEPWYSPAGFQPKPA